MIYYRPPLAVTMDGRRTERSERQRDTSDDDWTDESDRPTNRGTQATRGEHSARNDRLWRIVRRRSEPASGVVRLRVFRVVIGAAGTIAKRHVGPYDMFRQP